VNPRVRFEDEADLEYRLAGRWYEERREHLGLEFLVAIDAAIDRIVDLPRSGSPVPRMSTDLPVRRIAVKRFPYHVIYLETKAQIRILAIAHDRRKPGYWETRLR
jgi:plasmid stabilization system protein ParE